MSTSLRVGVIGHVEAMEFAVVAHLPAAGEIVHAEEVFAAAAGGGSVAAVVMREQTGAATFWTALGDDARGDAALAELRDARGVDVRAARRPGVATRRGFTHLSRDGERTITVIGERLAPAAGDDVDVRGYDGVFVTAADEEVLRAARAAGVLVATPRVGPALAASGVELDALVASATDPGEQVDVATWAAPPRVVVRTEGASGGHWETADGERGTWRPAPLPGPPLDAYGCGDSFVAALTVALAGGATVSDACAAAAEAGARRLTLRGPYGT